jgi:hypothetical protein
VLINSTIGMNRTTHLKKQQRVRSLALEQQKPMTTLQQVEYIEQRLRSAIWNKFNPLMETFNCHLAHRADTEFGFITC